MIRQLYLTLIVLAVATSISHAADDNIARGKSYTFSIAPNYSYCTEDGDVTDLTDGERTTSKVDNFWTHEGCVGWAHTREPIQITLDLESVQPIAGVSYCSAAGSAGVSWPSAIRISVSEDGESFYDVGDLVRLHDGYLPPAYGVYDVVKWHTRGLETKGRYIRLTVVPSGTFAFVDEIEVYRGNDAWMNKPYAGDPMPSDSINMPDDLALTQRGVYMRIRRDIETVAAMDGLADADRAELKQLHAEVNASSWPAQLEGFRAVVPVNDLHARLFQVHARVLDRAGHSGLTIWQSPPYDLLGMFQTPGEDDPTFEVKLMNGERRTAVFNVTNATPNPQNIAFHFEDLPNTLRPHAVEYVDTRENIVVASALIPLTASETGYHCDVPSGMTRQVWIMVEPRDLEPGAHQGRIVINGRTFPFTIDIAPVTFPEQVDMTLTTWDYTVDKVYGVTDANQQAMRDFIMADPLLNSVWAAPGSTPRPKSVDAEGNIGPIDFARWDAYVKMFPGKKHYFVFAHFGQVKQFFGHEIGTETFDRALRQWAKTWGDHNRDVLGLKPKQAAVLMIDEPGNADWFERTWAFSKPFYEATDHVAVFNDPSARALEEPYGMELIEASDIVCPTRHHFDLASTDIQQRLMRLPEEGKELWLYMCSGPTRAYNVAYFRLQPWHGRVIGATGSGFWALGDTGRANSWNEYVAVGKTGYTPLYIDDTSIHTSIHWEACREGVMDWQAMKMLEDRIAELKQRGVNDQAIADAEQLLATLPKQVIDEVHAEYGEHYASSSGNVSGGADAGRLKVLTALTALAAFE